MERDLVFGRGWLEIASLKVITRTLGHDARVICEEEMRDENCQHSESGFAAGPAGPDGMVGRCCNVLDANSMEGNAPVTQVPGFSMRWHIGNA
jgi:hypothetical protein